MSREDTAKLVGKLATVDAGRDAIHVAVAPVVAAENLNPGQHIGVYPDGRAGATGSDVGIVDPFLTSRVAAGQRFFLFLYPGTITSLRHVWTHNAFAEESSGATVGDKAVSEKWLRDFMKQHGFRNYEGMIAVASGQSSEEGEYGEGWYGGSGYLCTYGYDNPISEIPSEFWRHVEIVTGTKIEHRAEFFSCSC